MSLKLKERLSFIWGLGDDEPVNSTAGGRMIDGQVTDGHLARDTKPRSQGSKELRTCFACACSQAMMLIHSFSIFPICFSDFLLRRHYIKN